MFCEKCGFNSPDGSSFCAMCGQPLRTPLNSNMNDDIPFSFQTQVCQHKKSVGIFIILVLILFSSRLASENYSIPYIFGGAISSTIMLYFFFAFFKPESATFGLIKTKWRAVTALGIIMIIFISILTNLHDTNSEPQSPKHQYDDTTSVKNTTTKSSAKPPVQPVSIGEPNQVEFEKNLIVFEETFNKAEGEIAKSKVYRNQASYLRNYLKQGNISNWEGIIDKIETTEGGDFACVYIKALNGRYITYRTWNNTLSDSGDNTMIALNSKVYKQLERLKEGDQVVFSGSFIPDNKKGFKEISLTESGFVTHPEFLIHFQSISKK
jgi:hypothetical protein